MNVKDIINILNDNGLSEVEELVAAVDDIATGGSQVIPYGIHIDLRFCQLQVTEEDAIQVVVVILTCVGENYIKILTALVDNGCETDNLGTCADNDNEL